MKEFKIQRNSIYFIDTNIWLYSFIQSQNREKTEIAKTIIKECEIVISTQIINEMCVNLIKKVNFSEMKIQNLVQSLYRKFTVFELSQDILLKSSEIRANHTFSFWDSVVAASALDCDANYLISEDMQDGFNLENKLTIINPFT
ncbi:MAG: PIN domain-containing protein [Deltaproteobacteria bacterium]|jgi:predicted nucleic acid-binding protein|nr:PIN domain-containing protein [Deltaproteobacteria bacterium]